MPACEDIPCVRDKICLIMSTIFHWKLCCKSTIWREKEHCASAVISYLHQNKYELLNPCLLLNHPHGPNLEKSRTSKGIEMSLLETVKPSANLSRDLELFVGRCVLDPLLKWYCRRRFSADIISSVDMCPKCKSSATLWSASVETLWMIRKWRNNHKWPV